MPLYTIQRWDSIITKNSTFPFPMIYIKNSPEFETYARENNFMFTSIISNSGLYDNNPIICFVNYPLDRPNFFKDTDLTTIILFCNWIGYPQQNGKIFLRGLEGRDKIQPDTNPLESLIPKSIQMEGYENINNRNTNYLYLRIFFYILISLIIIFCFSKCVPANSKV